MLCVLHTQHSGRPAAQGYDFRRPDRIAKDRLRAIRLLHENFARTLGSSLSGYLRAYAVANLISVEQLPFLEFTLLQILSPAEAVVAIRLEIRIGDVSGMMNIGIPSNSVKLLRNRFDQQWSLRRTASTEPEQSRVFRLMESSELSVDARVESADGCLWSGRKARF